MQNVKHDQYSEKKEYCKGVEHKPFQWNDWSSHHEIEFQLQGIFFSGPYKDFPVETSKCFCKIRVCTFCFRGYHISKVQVLFCPCLHKSFLTRQPSSSNISKHRFLIFILNLESVHDASKLFSRSTTIKRFHLDKFFSHPLSSTKKHLQFFKIFLLICYLHKIF